MTTGVVANKGVNVDEAGTVGQNIIEGMEGKQISEFSFKKKNN